ncbi:hypothetical protein DL770_009337 [Monosporascus sp. CRB-9-2]|nr:hypothetical protein DL770_009337 [Monosporascus sp. CRB-9-2]
MAGRLIPHKKDAARDHPALSLATSFRSGSPFANEILASDIAESSGDDEAADGDFRGGECGSDAGSQGGGDSPVLYKQPRGVAYGVRRPSVLPERVHEVTLNEAERMQPLDAERSLLRDNHLLPLKARRTKVPNVVGGHEDVPRISVDPPSESAPLLAGADETPEHLNEQWESAVASGKIKTTWKREAQTIAVYSRPLIVTFLLQYRINIARSFAVGRIGKGLAQSLDTLCAQAYGSGHKHLVGLQLQRMTYFAAQSTLVTLTPATHQIPFPVSIVASTHVANLIGARLVAAAKTSAKGLYAAFAIGVFNLALLASLRYQPPLLFTRDEEVIAIVTDVMPLCAVMQVFDGLTAMAHGLLRGIGKQSVGGYANLATYYLVETQMRDSGTFGYNLIIQNGS